MYLDFLFQKYIRQIWTHLTGTFPCIFSLVVYIFMIQHVKNFIACRSKSLSQMFLVVLSCLFLNVGKNCNGQKSWKKNFVLYVNMCYLNWIMAVRALLPLQHPFNKLWLGFCKVIDVFHLFNHKRSEYETTYNLKDIQTKHPDLKKSKTKGAEQTVSFFS